jgi:eukaryotic-like serine/threonine-protein kinase
MSDNKLEVLGRYKILDIVGRGAMGVVYKAVDPVIDRVVAIKTVNLSLSKDDLEEYEARFQQEIKAAGRLNHPNIVTIYDVGRTEQVAYMAMEFLEGKELKDILAAGERPNVETTVDLMAQVADGLAFAHEREVVHRDIKPSNIMIVKVPNGVLAKVTDFGIARMPASAVKTMTGMILGSPRYMSPEQVIGKTIDSRSDIFSLGVVLYETLTGIAPFDGDNVNAIMYATVNTNPVPPSTLHPVIPTMLDLIVAKALAKPTDDRYQTMREFGADLREVKRLIANAISAPSLAAAKSAPPKAAAGSVAVAGRLQKSEEKDDANPLKLNKKFDSFDATMRLAALTQQTEDFREYISETQKMRAYKGKIDPVIAAKLGVETDPALNVQATPPAREVLPPAPERPKAKTPVGAATSRVEPVQWQQPSSVMPMIVIGVLAVAVIGLLVALLMR